jgi:hypothetical protein
MTANPANRTCPKAVGWYSDLPCEWRERLPNGRLPAPPHDATGHTWHHSDKELFGMIKTGIPEIVPGYQTDMAKI